MIVVDNFLLSGSLKTRLTMQVHDELVLEVSENEKAIIVQNIPALMASVGEGVLDVPLVAEVGMGKNWDDAH